MLTIQAERARLRREVEVAERALVQAGLRDREAFDRAWQARQAALDELERLDWLEKAEEEDRQQGVTP
jgi:hypothetical protein